MGVEVRADLDLGLSLGQLADEVRELRKSIIVLPTWPRPLANTLVTPTSVAAPFIISLGGPLAPVIWDLRNLTVCGADDHTTVANVTAAIYAGLQEQSVGQAARAAGSAQLPDVRWTGMAVPSSQPF